MKYQILLVLLLICYASANTYGYSNYQRNNGEGIFVALATYQICVGLLIISFMIFLMIKCCQKCSDRSSFKKAMKFKNQAYLA